MKKKHYVIYDGVYAHTLMMPLDFISTKKMDVLQKRREKGIPVYYDSKNRFYPRPTKDCIVVREI